MLSQIARQLNGTALKPGGTATVLSLDLTTKSSYPCTCATSTCSTPGHIVTRLMEGTQTPV